TRYGNSRDAVILASDLDWLQPYTRHRPKYSQTIPHALLQEIEENRRRTTLKKLLTCGDTCGGTAGSGVGNLFARSAAGDQADDFQFRQRRIGAHVQAQAITATGNRQNHAIIPHLRLRLDIDDRLYSQRIYKIDVAPRDRIAISLKDQRSTA